MQDKPRRAHLEQRATLRSHLALADEQCRQAFCREVAYLVAFIATIVCARTMLGAGAEKAMCRSQEQSRSVVRSQPCLFEISLGRCSPIKSWPDHWVVQDLKPT